MAAWKWKQAIDEVPINLATPKSFTSYAAAVKFDWEYVEEKNRMAWSLAQDAHDRRENDADNATYELLANYGSAAYMAACDAAHLALEGKHDRRCPNGSCTAIYVSCQKESFRTLETGVLVRTPQCKPDVNGHLPGIVLN